jgi:hypothetical protein
MVSCWVFPFGFFCFGRTLWMRSRKGWGAKQEAKVGAKHGPSLRKTLMNCGYFLFGLFTNITSLTWFEQESYERRLSISCWKNDVNYANVNNSFFIFMCISTWLVRIRFLLSMEYLRTQHRRRWLWVSLVNQHVQLWNLSPLLRFISIKRFMKSTILFQWSRRCMAHKKHDIDHFIKECVCLFHNKQLRDYLFLSFLHSVFQATCYYCFSTCFSLSIREEDYIGERGLF